MSNAFDVTVDALRKQGLNSDEILKELSKLFRSLADSNNESAAKKNTDAKIRKLLKKLCMPVQVGGYNYWVDAIMLYKENDGKLGMCEVYTQIAKKYEITYSKAERAMRFAVECVFEKCEKEVVKKMFGTNISSRTGITKNKQFMVILAEQI